MEEQYTKEVSFFFGIFYTEKTLKIIIKELVERNWIFF